MKVRLITILLLIICSSCNNKQHEPITLTDGTYKGIFGRSSPNAKYQASEVTLVFKGDTFEGESSISKYPAICNGTFTQKDQKIEFSNQCVWTADFDGSYILDGEFSVSTEGKNIIISRSYGGDTYDTYTLMKQ